MEYFQRDDGTVIVGVQRESIFTLRRGEARREIEHFVERDVADDMGKGAERYALLSPLPGDDGWSVALASTEGYLLAECLAAQFGDNFAYVEDIGSHRCILIVVIKGAVVADMAIGQDELKTDLATHFLDHKLHLRVAGDLPVGVANEDGNPDFYVPPDDALHSFERLELDYRLHVPLHARAKLLPWKQACNKAIGSTWRRPLTAAAVIAAVSILAIQLWPSDEPKKAANEPPPDPLAVPYGQWSARALLGEGLQITSTLSLIGQRPPGWRPKLVKVDGGQASLLIEPDYELATFQSATRVLGESVAPVNGTRNAQVSYPLSFTSRDRARFERVLGHGRDPKQVVDYLNQAMWGFKAAVQSASQGIGYRTTQISIQGEVPELVLRNASQVLSELLPNATIESLEYDPSSTKLTLLITLFTRG